MTADGGDMLMLSVSGLLGCWYVLEVGNVIGKVVCEMEAGSRRTDRSFYISMVPMLHNRGRFIEMIGYNRQVWYNRKNNSTSYKSQGERHRLL